ncbi:NAD(+) diphosphatase [Gordonia crocea]|uniref:NAD(+) diphosphatase n=1 Tax=Gordonia crocea TaxID=589162 RepID=A0A7I9V1N6_9ACTN|nr:NAD(+) diphosphatase [Gordonia crocea]GED98929.1 putative NADH pyrophosphatase/NUDIX hydrolase [Gordonia crocea]GED99549.1 putative NADH pyrophosphatase/NUDIX hydrolase [Gordonia crocea]
MAFEMPQPPLFSRSTVDRGGEFRGNRGAAVQGWDSARVLLIDRRGRFGVGESGGLRWVSGPTVAPSPPEDLVLLGVEGEVFLWARRVDDVAEPLGDARSAGHHLGGDDAGLLVTALGMLNWHDHAEFSPTTGSPTSVEKSGWVRRDRSCGREEFPRTDPAIITVVHDGADRILLGRQAMWPERWYSTLAGFVEPGESLEQCVVREVREEVGITVTEPRYLGSQPWPFPRSLMVGFAAIGDPDEPLQFLDGEIADAVWFTREQVRDALAAGEWAAPDDDDAASVPLRLPGSVSIARAMVETWAAAS